MRLGNVLSAGLFLVVLCIFVQTQIIPLVERSVAANMSGPVTHDYGSTVVNVLVQIGISLAEFMTVAGVFVACLPQYITIWRTRNTVGFSLYVCLSLIVAGILRITFWFGHRYEIPLLLQAIALVIMMLAIVHLCTVINAADGKITEQRTFFDFRWQDFWNWTDFTSYVTAVILFSSVCGMLMYFFHPFRPFVEFVGFLSLFIEAVLGAPQFVRNFRRKATDGVSLLTWALITSGDAAKIVYFVLRTAPAQFWICGSLQVSIDCAIWIQVFLYRESKGHLREKSSSGAVDSDSSLDSEADLVKSA